MEDKSQLANYMYKKIILRTFLLICLSFTNQTNVFSQSVPPVSGAQCVSCKQMNGQHALDCPYNNKSQGQSATTPLINNNQEQQLVFGLLFQLNDQIDQWVAKEEAKQAAIDKSRKKIRQNAQDSINAINHQNTKQQLKGLPTNNKKELIANSYRIINCKIKNNGLTIYKDGVGKTYYNCSEIENITLNKKDTLSTGKGTEIMLSNDNGNKIKLNENTTFTPNNEGLDYSKLIKGALWAIVKNDQVLFEAIKRKCKLDIRTPAACACVRGTTLKINITDKNYTEIFLIEGELEVETINKEEKIILTPGKKITFTPEGRIDTISYLDVEALKELIQEFNNQD
ncbi:MAG: FecR domain-containing protein [Bacteroidia bacterium]|nr:FecR domain-containing protein [Bacteroidia bacterium]